MRYAMVLLSKVIDIVVDDTIPSYPPDQRGNPVITVECGEDVVLGMLYNPETEEFYEYIPEPEPIPPLEETDTQGEVV